ncbi:MAG: type IX secretion system membrane protein PorP/SprF [Flavobacteriales bacterium]|nr:MAG: type IX secretion system membrane protein PorP/SprF [Flavobacteriales bacterium]
MRRIITAVVCAAALSTATAQQDPQFTQYMHDRLSINPGSAGTTGNMCLTALLRQQWTGFDGAPKTGLINFQMPISAIRSGVGLSLYLDQLGQQKNTLARLHYSYHVKLQGGLSTLGIGLYAGMTSRSLGNDWVSVDPVTSDDAIPDNGSSATGFDLGLGLYYKSPTLYAGISTTQLPETGLDAVSIKNARHYYILAGYNWEINNKFILQPSALVKSDGASTQLDIGTSILYNKMVWLGVSFRTEDAIAPYIGFQRESADGKSAWKIGYAYDVTTSELKNYSSGSHEIMLNYCFKIVKPPKVFESHHPLFL